MLYGNPIVDDSKIQAIDRIRLKSPNPIRMRSSYSLKAKLSEK
jgi:hypothetical protein